MKHPLAHISSHMLKKAQTATGFLFLVCACSIYLIFRSRDITLYRWCSSLGLAEHIQPLRMSASLLNVPDFIKYSLPDGLYCASYILLMNAAWQDKGAAKTIAVSLIPSAAILHEAAQGLGIANGTFDVNDLVCYALPLAIYLTIHLTSYLSTYLSTQS